MSLATVAACSCTVNSIQAGEEPSFSPGLGRDRGTEARVQFCMPVAGAVLITSAPQYYPSLLVNFDPNVPLARAPGFSRLGFKYLI